MSHLGSIFPVSVIEDTVLSQRFKKCLVSAKDIVFIIYFSGRPHIIFL